MNGKSKEAKNQVNQANIFEREELVKKADVPGNPGDVTGFPIVSLFRYLIS
nr:hypothetical protein [uncultured Acetatifactor sp.]